MMNNYELTSSSVHTQHETSRGTKRPHLSSSSQASRQDYPVPSDAEAEGRSPRRMRMSPTNSFGGSIAGLNLQVTEIQNTAAPRPLNAYGSPPPPPPPPPEQSQSQPRTLPRTLPLPPQRQHQLQQQQRKKHQGPPPLLVHRPGKRTVYVQDVVFELLVTSHLETSNHAS